MFYFVVYDEEFDEDNYFLGGFENWVYKIKV